MQHAGDLTLLSMPESAVHLRSCGDGRYVVGIRSRNLLFTARVSMIGFYASTGIHENLGKRWSFALRPGGPPQD